MSLGRPLAPLQLEREQREQLEATASSRSLPHGLVTRVRIVLLSADGLANRPTDLARLRLAAAPSASLSAFQRPVLRREGTGYCRVVSEPTG
jgi:hypothetical protein